MTKARELAELAKAVTVVDNQIYVDRTIKEHLGKLGVLKQQKDSNGKVQRGRFVLKIKFKLNKEITEQEAMDLYKDPTKYRQEMDKFWAKPIEDSDYWDADPATVPKHVKEKKVEKDYSHFFITQDEKGNTIPHPDRHTIAPEGATTEMTKSDVIEAFNDAREKGTDIVDI